MKPLTQKRLKECLAYDPTTGIFVWKIRLGTRHKIGDVAGRICNGQRQIGIDREQYSAASLAWLYMTGKLPKHFIDHKDRNGDNQRFANLREATRTQNQHNRSVFKNATSGYKGVTFHKKSERWIAQITVNRKHMWLGFFKHAQHAAVAYDVAAKKYFKEFACLNFSTDRDWLVV